MDATRHGRAPDVVEALGIATRDPELARALLRFAPLVDAWTPLGLMGEPGSGCRTFAAFLDEGMCRWADCCKRPLGAADLLREMVATWTAGTASAPRPSVVVEHPELLPAALQAWFAEVIESVLVRASVQPESMASCPRPVLIFREPVARLLADGRLDPDLASLIAGSTLRLPPLRERRADIPDLAEGLAVRWSRRSGQPKVLDPEAQALLLRQPWKGNLRELSAVVRNAVLASGRRQVIGAQDLGLPVQEPGDDGACGADGLAGLPVSCEDPLRRAVILADGNLSRAAMLASVSRTTLYKRSDLVELAASLRQETKEPD